MSEGYETVGEIKGGNRLNVSMTMTNDMWKDCNDMIGRILTYLDEDEVRRATKAAVKSEIWAFHNKHNGDDYDQEQDRFNR